MLYAVKEPKNKKAKRALMAREPKVNENEKNAMFIHGHTISATVKLFLDELYAMKQPCGVKLTRKNKILPFEDEHPVEFLAHKNDASLFLLGNSNKKRPDNVVMGRCFDFHLLDQVEFGLFNFKSVREFSSNSPGLGMRPCFVCCGEEFETKPEFKTLANLFLDFFRGRPTTMINLRGLENVIVLTAVEGRVFFRHYTVQLQKSDQNLPRVELEEVGPSFDLEIRRSKLASEEAWKQACFKPSSAKPKKTKNLEIDTLGNKLGNELLNELTGLVTKKGKALRGRREEEEEGTGHEDEGRAVVKKTKKSKHDVDI